MKFYSDENSHYHALLSRVKFDDKKAVLLEKLKGAQRSVPVKSRVPSIRIL